MFEEKTYRPLADELRPRTLDDVVGQSHILGKGGLLRPVSGYTDVISFRIIISAGLAYVYLGAAAAYRRRKLRMPGPTGNPGRL